MAECKCKNCGERHINCHSTCESYKSFRKEQDVQNEKIRKSKEREAALDDIEIRRARRVKLWHGKR